MEDRTDVLHIRHFCEYALIATIGVLFISNTLLPGRVFAETASTTESSTPQPVATSSKPFNPYDSADVEARVREYFADIPPMIMVAKCESRFRQYDSTGNVLDGGAGSMIGVYQINRPVHEKTALSLGFDIDTVEGNLGYARHLYDESGTVPWISVYECWNRELELERSSAQVVGEIQTLQTSFLLTKTLKMGVENNEVLTLQKMLNRAGFTVAEEGPGSPGNETTTFGSLTRAAVRQFQCAQGIACDGDEKSTGYGLVGPRTRVALLKFLADTPVEEFAAL